MKNKLEIKLCKPGGGGEFLFQQPRNGLRTKFKSFNRYSNSTIDKLYWQFLLYISQIKIVSIGDRQNLVIRLGFMIKLMIGACSIRDRVKKIPVRMPFRLIPLLELKWLPEINSAILPKLAVHDFNINIRLDLRSRSILKSPLNIWTYWAQ